MSERVSEEVIVEIREQFQKQKSWTDAEIAQAVSALDELLALREQSGEPVAWRWDEATYTEHDVRGRCWQYNLFGTQKPNTPWMQRNVTPLYTAPPSQPNTVSVPREPVAIKLASDPEDERDGPWFSLEDLAKLRALPAGTKLYVGK